MLADLLRQIPPEAAAWAFLCAVCVAIWAVAYAAVRDCGK